MTPRLPAAARREQLLDVSVAVFARNGFQGTSMDDVAEAAGVTKPVLYQHFTSKQALVHAVLRDLSDQLRDEVTRATAAAGGPREQVEDGFLAYFQWVARRRAGFDVLFSGEARRDPALLAEVMAVEAELADVIAQLIVIEGLTRDRRRLLAFGIVGLAETTCRHWLASDADLDVDDLARQVAALAWAGLRGQQPG